MSMLLTKRLARSLWRTKLRLSAVILMVAIGVFAGIAFGAYANSATTLYDDIYADDEQGVNLPDLWVENNAGNWNATTSNHLCQEIREQWPSEILELDHCEARLKSNGQFFSEDAEIGMIPAVWQVKLTEFGFLNMIAAPDEWQPPPMKLSSINMRLRD